MRAGEGHRQRKCWGQVRDWGGLSEGKEQLGCLSGGRLELFNLRCWEGELGRRGIGDGFRAHVEGKITGRSQ